MDILTSIESEIKTVLQYIAVPIITSASPPPVGYQYKTTTGTVNIEDESVSLSLNTDTKKVNYCIYMEDSGEMNNEWSIGQNAYTNSLSFRIEARVHNTSKEGNPKYAINVKLNEVLADLKKVFYSYWNLNGKCSYIKYTTSRRQFNESNNRINTADLIFYVTVVYAQSGSNPDIQACM